MRDQSNVLGNEGTHCTHHKMATSWYRGPLALPSPGKTVPASEGNGPTNDDDLILIQMCVARGANRDGQWGGM